MSLWLRITLILGVLLAIGFVVIVLGGSPRLVEVSPVDGEQNVSAKVEVRITFSRPMQTTGVDRLITFKPTMTGSFHWQENTLIFTPEKPWPAGSMVQVTLHPGIRASSFPFLALRQEKTWSFRLRLSGVLYLYPSTGPANIYLVNPVSGEIRQLTDYPEGVLDYAIASDGSYLYLSRTDRRGISKIEVVELSNGQTVLTSTLQTTLTESMLISTPLLDCTGAICQGLALDPTGKFLAYERTALPESDGPHFPQVWFVSLSDGKPGEPVLAGDPSHQTIEPAWSSMGWLAYYDKTDLAYHFIEPQGEKKIIFKNQTGEVGAWRPDGEAFLAPEISYLTARVSPDLSNLKSFADSHLILFNLKTGNVEDLTPAQGIEDATPVYSPDGQFLAFARKYLDIERWTPGRQLWLAEVESRAARQLTDSPLYNHFDFVWNPSGSQLAFSKKNQSVINEPPEIWIFDLLANQETRLVQGGFHPLWVP